MVRVALIVLALLGAVALTSPEPTALEPAAAASAGPTTEPLARSTATTEPVTFGPGLTIEGLPVPAKVADDAIHLGLGAPVTITFPVGGARLVGDDVLLGSGTHTVRLHGERGLEFDHILSPGTPTSAATFTVTGHEHLALEDGRLAITSGVTVHLAAPFAYQETAAGRVPVDVAYVLDGDRVGFDVGPYDPLLPLVIDPLLELGTYLGAGTTWASDLATKDVGGSATRTRVYVVGWTTPPDPIAAPTGFPAAIVHGTPNRDTGFVAAYLHDASTMTTTPEWFAYIGGSLADRIHAVKVDGVGRIHIVGETRSADYPTKEAFTSPHDGSVLRGAQDAVVTVLDDDGSLLFSTYLGGDGSEAALDVEFWGGRSLVTGWTDSGLSGPFPVVKATQDKKAAGRDAFVTGIDGLAGPGVVAFSTYLGGQEDDEGRAIGYDATGIVVGGNTGGLLSTFPTSADAQRPFNDADGAEGFAAKYRIDGTHQWTTLVGGDGADSVAGVVVLGGDAVLLGTTDSTDMACSCPGYVTTPLGGRDLFLHTLNATGALVNHTYLGGPNHDDGADLGYDVHRGHLLIVGTTDGMTWTAAPLPSPDRGAFVMRFADKPVLTSSLGADGDDRGTGIGSDRHMDLFAASACLTCTPTLKSAIQSAPGGDPSATLMIIAKVRPTAGIQATGGHVSFAPASHVEPSGVSVDLIESHTPGDLPLAPSQWRLYEAGVVVESSTGSVPSFSPLSRVSGSYIACVTAADDDPHSDVATDKVCMLLDWAPPPDPDKPDPDPPDPPVHPCRRPVPPAYCGHGPKIPVDNPDPPDSPPVRGGRVTVYVPSEEHSVSRIDGCPTDDCARPVEPATVEAGSSCMPVAPVLLTATRYPTGDVRVTWQHNGDCPLSHWVLEHEGTVVRLDPAVRVHTYDASADAHVVVLHGHVPAEVAVRGVEEGWQAPPLGVREDGTLEGRASEGLILLAPLFVGLFAFAIARRRKR